MVRTPEDQQAPYRDASLPVEERVQDLLGRMTLEEKISQMVCAFGQSMTEDADGASFDATVGGLSHLIRAAIVSPREGARRVNAYQRRAVEETRLGIPILFNEEALCGLQVQDATVFPQAISQAATWDPELIERMATAVRRQMLAIGARQALSPLCDIAPDPRWGRLEETYGEDPYLAGEISTGFVRGLQGEDPSSGTIASLKHFIAYGASVGGRNCHPAHVGPRALREQYGLPFEMAIREGSARGIMSSYNQIDAVPVQSSREMLTDLLRGEYGFEGIVISDLGAVEQLATRHHTAADLKEAAAQSVEAGLDLDLCNTSFAGALGEAVSEGRLPEAEIDRAAATVLRWKFLLGLFEQPYVDEDVPEVLERPEDRDLALEVARASIVLLQNEPVDGHPLLPLSGDLGSVAVIGPTADRALSLLGDYAYPVISNAVGILTQAFDPTAVREGEGFPKSIRVSPDDLTMPETTLPIPSVLDGVRAAVGDGTDVRYARGCPIVGHDDQGIAEAVAAAREAEVAIVVVGDQSGLITAGTVGEGIDGASCELPGLQRRLVEEVAATGTPTVVVLTNGRPFVLGWMRGRVHAIIEAFFCGEEAGNAIADVLFGTVNPGGRLPVSMPAHVGAAPAPYNRAFGVNTYYDADLDPVFAFGHGLSYTSFAYDALALSSEQIPTDGLVEVSCRITNTGDRAGDEIVQLYLRDPVARTSRPWIELKGFQRLSLQPGESARVTFRVAADRVALYDPAEGWVVEPGEIKVLVGSSSADIRLEGSFTITGSTRVTGPGRELRTQVAVERA